ncbi:MAG TPA: serine/threonine-protein kinase [Myxococcota bacterium]
MSTPLPSTSTNETPREPLARRALALRLLPGTTVAGYVVGEPLGEGGMGQVYAAVDERLGRPVALKVLIDDDDESRARFLREARALARIEHHNVVRVYASGEARSDLCWMALEVIRGDPLSALADGTPLDEETAVGLCAQIARGLAAVHAVGVVHRDVKPSNVLVDDDATVKLIDFGVAQLSEHGGGFTTKVGVVVGTPHFMSPEQARGGVVDARSDAWGLGATLYALLAGTPPFFGSVDEADLDILARVVRDDVADIRTLAPSTSAATAALVRSLLQRDANARPSDLGIVADELEQIGTALAAGAVPSSSSSSSSSSAAIDVPLTSASSTVPLTPQPPLPLHGRGGEDVGRAARRPFLSVVAIVFVVVAALVGGVVGGRYLFAPDPQIVERIVEVAPPPVAPVVPVVVAPPEPVPVPEPPPAPATADDIAVAVVTAPVDARDDAVAALLTRTDELGVDALAIVLTTPGSIGDVVLSKLAASDRDDTDALLERVLSSTTAPRARQLKAIDHLRARRNDRALSLLMRFADTHKDRAVRAHAADARDSIFKVE